MVLVNSSRSQKIAPTHSAHLPLGLHGKQQQQQQNVLIPTLLWSDIICVPRTFCWMLSLKWQSFLLSSLLPMVAKTEGNGNIATCIAKKQDTEKNLIADDQALLWFTGRSNIDHINYFFK